MDKHEKSFTQSLEELTCDDLAPKKEVKPHAGALLRQIGGIALVCVCLGVAIWSSAKLFGSLSDFFSAEEKYDMMANEFSPVTGTQSGTLALRRGIDCYPLAPFELMKDGNALYPENDGPLTDLPDLNPGTDPSPDQNPPPSFSESAPLPSEPDPETPSISPTPESPDPQPSESPDPQPEEDPLLSSEMFDSFCQKLTGMQNQYQNNDIFAWIYIPGTNINYPIVKSGNNEYYLNRDVSKKWNTAGSIYLDYRNDKNLLNNPFSVLYGHNIRTKGIMFNRLLELLKEEHFERCRYVYVYTKEAALKYEIFSVYTSDASQSPTISIPKSNNAAFLEKIRDIQNKSIHQQRAITLYESDHVLLLYTCSNAQSSNDRVYVAGVLVGIGL